MHPRGSWFFPFKKGVGFFFLCFGSQCVPNKFPRWLPSSSIYTHTQAANRYPCTQEGLLAQAKSGDKAILGSTCTSKSFFLLGVSQGAALYFYFGVPTSSQLLPNYVPNMLLNFSICSLKMLSICSPKLSMSSPKMFPIVPTTHYPIIFTQS